MADVDAIKARINLAEVIGQSRPVKKSGSELAAQCPFCDDGGTHLSIGKEAFHCFKCGKSGNVFQWLQWTENIEFAEAVRKASDLAGIVTTSAKKTQAPAKKPPVIPLKVAEEYHAKMPEVRRQYYRNRGLTDETINRYKLGWDGTRYTIPVIVNGELLNIRRRRDDTNKQDKGPKMLPYKTGYGTVVIFNQEMLDGAEYAVVTEGEFDAMLLVQHGFPAVSGTGGATAFKDEWVPLFASCRLVYICYDNDDEGQRGAARAAEALGDKARIVSLPKEVGEKGDVTDFFVELGRTDADFEALLQEAVIYEPPPLPPDEEVKNVHLAQSAHSDLVKQKVSVKVLCAGKLDAPYIVPRRVRYICFASEKEREACGADADDDRSCGYWDKTFDDTDNTFIELCHKRKPQLGTILRAAAGCQANCKKFTFQILEYANVEEILAVPMADKVMPSVNSNGKATDLDESGNEYVARNLYLLDDTATVNQYYRVTGRVYPHPNTQLGTILITRQEPMQDNIEQFKLTDEIRTAFRVFQPGGDLVRHVETLLDDLTVNVTRIYKRDEALLGILLAYHSILSFEFEGRRIRRGWVEVLLLGDTGQGKTDMVRSVMEYIGLGMLASGETARRTGLCYSVQQVAERWFVKWGVYVLSDRRLLAIDELSELPLEDLGRMTQGRNDGVMHVEQAGVGEANCRTRLIWISNPRHGKQLENYSHGIESLKTLFPTPADLRRIDFAVLLAEKDIDANEINKPRAKPEQRLISASVLRQSVLWAWSRRPDHVVIDERTTETILNEASRLSLIYAAAGDVPLVTAADIRNKLARLSVALAALLHSTDDAHEKVIVEPLHVKFISAYLDSIYQHRNCRYDIYAGYAAKKSILDETETDEITTELAALDSDTAEDTDKDKKTVSRDILALYRKQDTFSAIELGDLLDVHRKTVAKRLRVLQRHGLIVKGRYGYNKTPKFIEYLSKVEYK